MIGVLLERNSVSHAKMWTQNMSREKKNKLMNWKSSASIRLSYKIQAIRLKVKTCPMWILGWGIGLGLEQAAKSLNLRSVWFKKRTEY